MVLECSTFAVFCLTSLTLRLVFCSHHFCCLLVPSCVPRLYSASLASVSCTSCLSLSVTQSVVAATHKLARNPQQ